MPRLEESVALVKPFEKTVPLCAFHTHDFTTDFPLGKFQFVKCQLEKRRTRYAFALFNGIVLSKLGDKLVLHFARFTLDRNFRTASRPTTRCPTATRLLDTGERDARQSASTKAPASFALLIVKLSVMLEVAIFHLALIFIVNAKPTKQNEFITVLDEFQAKYSRK